MIDVHVVGPEPIERELALAELDEEHFATPAWAVDVIVPHLPLSGLIVDPCSGAGAIAGRLVETWGVAPFRVTAVELHPGRAEQDRQRLQGAQVVSADFLGLRQGVEIEQVSLVVGNPPFSQSKLFVEKALELVASCNGTVAMLLRLSWLSSKDRRALLKTHPPDVYVLSTRPSFAATLTCGVKGKSKGCGWRVSIAPEAPRTKSCPTCNGAVSCTTTDATDYGWFCWGPGRGGRWFLPDGGPPDKAAV